VSHAITISVIVPSYQQGKFIGETITSIVDQKWPSLELMVFDGGSTDRTIEILRGFGEGVSYWESRADRGQAHAINKGFDRASGELVAWQNSDDCYYPGAFAAVASAAAMHPDVDVFYGDKDYVDFEGRFLFTAWARDPHDFSNMIPWPCVHNEVTFVRRRVLETGLRLNESRRHYMDYEFFWDLLLAGKRFMHVPGIRAGFRQHPNAKTSTQGEVAQREAFEIYVKVWRSGKLNGASMSAMAAAIWNECRNDFAAARWSLFIEHMRQARGVIGRPRLPRDLRIKRLLVRLPPTFRDRLIGFGRGLREKCRQAGSLRRV